MKLLGVILLCLWITPFALGQERVEIPLLNETVWVKMLRKSNIIEVEFEEGDSAVFDIKVAKSKRIRKYSIYHSDTVLVKTYKRPSRLLGESFDIPKAGKYHVLFKNGGFFPREIDLTIRRFPRPLRDTIVVDTVLVEKEPFEAEPLDEVALDTIKSDSTFKVVRKVARVTLDTITEELLMTSLVLDAKLNINGQSKKVLELPIPSLVELKAVDNFYDYFWVTWIGVGGKASEEYEKLQSNPPMAWQNKGISHPLEAYAQGLLHVLPKGQGGVMLNAFYTKKGGTGSIRYNEFGGLGNLPLVSKSKHADFGKLLPLSLCLENKERVSPAEVHVKIMGFRIVKITGEEEQTPIIEIINRTEKIEKTE